MSGYIQRLLERSTSAPAGEAATAGLGDPHAQSAAPVRSPLAEADQRLQMADFDGDLLATILLENTAPQNDPWVPPDAPFGAPQDRQDPQAQVTPAPTMAPDLSLAPAHPFSPIPASEAVSTATPIFKHGEKSLVRESLQPEAPRPKAPKPKAQPAYSPKEAVTAPVSERIVERDETGLREPGETRYLFLRDSGLESKSSANPQPRDFVVEPLKQPEMFRNIVSPAQPLAITTGEAPAVDVERARSPAPARREVRAEPAHTRHIPETSLVAVPAAATAAASTASPQKQQELKTPEVHRGANEIAGTNEPLAPWRSASAASVIGPLPTRTVSLNIRGCRRR